MRTLIALTTVALGISEGGLAWAAANPVFNYTNTEPGAVTLPAGKIAVGTELKLGVFNSFQLGTRLDADLFQVFNANATLNILDDELIAIALTMAYQSYNPNHFSGNNPWMTVQSWQPGIVESLALAQPLALTLGGNLNFTNTDLSAAGSDTSSFVHGAVVGLDLSWAYLGKRRGKWVLPVLSIGATYDISYQVYSVGLSHHFRGLKLGIQYYPNVNRFNYNPLLSAGATLDL